MAIRTKFTVPAAEKKYEHKDFPGVPLPSIISGEFLPWKGWIFKVVGSKDMQVLLKLVQPTTNHAYKAMKEREREQRELNRARKRRKQ